MTVADRTGSRRTVPGWALRVAVALAALAAVLVVMLQAGDLQAAGAVGVLLALVGVGSALAPGSVCPLLLLIGLVTLRLAASTVFDVSLVVLIALLPLIHQLAGACATIPARSVCEVGALAPAARRYVVSVIPALIAAATVAVIF